MTRRRLPLSKVCVFVVVIVPASIHSFGDLPAAPLDGLRFEVVLPAAKAGKAQTEGEQKVSGRVMVVLGESGSRDPRLTVGETGRFQPPVLGRDVVELAPGGSATLDAKSAIFPITSLGELRPGQYAVQALLHRNPDLNYPNAPGDLYSPVVNVQLDKDLGGPVRLELSRAVPAEKLPADSNLIKYLKIPSRLLSDFYGRQDLSPRGRDPAAQLRPRARAEVPAPCSHRRLRFAVHRRRGNDEPWIFVPGRLDGG